MVSYRAGEWYVHGGISLQEAVVPVITVKMASQRPEGPQAPTIELRYVRQAKRITARLPVMEIDVAAGDLFSQGSTFEVLLEAHDKKGNVVGEAKPGGPVDAATRVIALKPGETVQVPLRMDLEFEGPFTVKLLDPRTLAAHCRLDLTTDYTV